MSLDLSTDELMFIAFVLVSVLIIVGVIFAFTGSSSGTTETAELHLQPVYDWEDFEGSEVSFEDLSSEQQDIFEQAVSRDSLTVSIDETSFWSENDAVNYEDFTYRTTVVQ